MRKIRSWIIVFTLIIMFIAAVLLQTSDGNKALDISTETTSNLNASTDVQNENRVMEEKETEDHIGEIVIDMKGEVNAPGVYELPVGSRVHEAVEKAGGFTSHADETSVNLAQIIADEMVILVPKEGEENVSIPQESGETKISINHGSETDLMSLPGIGAQKAKAIIEYREENGPLQSTEELLQISGIGVKTLEGFEDQISIH
ncbi:helix-hairpin-helix domain-containing protein [Halalkalibacillus halophilus]|uniref:helix-hairpin-helix domain-containing protein n=1 Tax=Halalkalibacillus halophilus TaxID=392827 RepID=UPI00041CA856|nr:helix-hairpin-helix domain-containing protein [Halalkalibacillus halophilus]